MAPKKAKDPNMPERARSAYEIWFDENKERINENMPRGISMGDRAREISLIWRGLGTAEKAQWQQRANDDKERFTREMKAYQCSSSENTKGKGFKEDDDDHDNNGKGGQPQQCK